MNTLGTSQGWRRKQFVGGRSRARGVELAMRQRRGSVGVQANCRPYVALHQVVCFRPSPSETCFRRQQQGTLEKSYPAHVVHVAVADDGHLHRPSQLRIGRGANGITYQLTSNPVTFK